MTHERKLGNFDTFGRTQWTATDRGYLAESVPFAYCGGATLLPTAGRLELVRLKLPSGLSVTNIVIVLSSGGGTLTSGQNFVALFDSTGARVGVSADQTAAWGTSGVKTAALAGGPFTVTGTSCFVGMWYNGTTAPTLIRAHTNSTVGLNAGFSTPNLLWSSADTGLTTTAPNPFGAQTAQANAWWVALS